MSEQTMNDEKETLNRQWSNKTVNGSVYPTKSSNNISDFVDPGTTPGNVALCFSGGGSVSMVATLGQLRALNELQVIDQSRAISTVSGGSWTVVPFTFLPDDIDDQTFLGEYVENPATLTLEQISQVSEGYLGYAVTLDGINWKKMAESVALLMANPKFPSDRAWNLQIARHILEPFGLAQTSRGLVPSIEPSWFTHTEDDAQTIKAANPNLPETYYTYQQGPNRIKRPYHLCNTTMLNQGAIPVQSTAKATGIFNYDATLNVGGGLASSYCFDSQLTSRVTNSIEVELPLNNKNAISTYSLTDMTANSSAFFVTAFEEVKLLNFISEKITPKYNYWPVAATVTTGTELPFADGGAIEDNGILNALAYDDIERIVSFTNALQGVWYDNSQTNGQDFDPMQVVVDQWLPTLFGYTPYQRTTNDKQPSIKLGYNLFSDIDSQDLAVKGFRFFENNQIFDSSLFAAFLTQLWESLDNYNKPATYLNQQMAIIENNTFNIKPRNIQWLLVHYGPNNSFNNALTLDVKAKLDALTEQNYQNQQKIQQKTGAKPTTIDDKFPNMTLLQTQMPAELVNLFAHFTSYNVMQVKDKILAMYND